MVPLSQPHPIGSIGFCNILVKLLFNPIPHLKAMDHWEPDSYPLEVFLIFKFTRCFQLFSQAARVLGEEEKVNMMGGGDTLEAAAVKEEPKLRFYLSNSLRLCSSFMQVGP